MLNMGRSLSDSENLKYDRLVHTVLDELRLSEVYLLVGNKTRLKSWIMLRAVVALIKTGVYSKVVYMKASSNLFLGHLTVKDLSDVTFIPEFHSIYQWLFEEVGEEQVKSWLMSGVLTLLSADNYDEVITEADVILLDEIHDMDAKMVHRILRHLQDDQKLLLTYQSDNRVFTDLMINEFRSIIHQNKSSFNLQFTLIDEVLIEDIAPSTLPLTTDLFKKLMITEIGLEVLVHNELQQLRFNVKDRHLELVDSQPSIPDRQKEVIPQSIETPVSEKKVEVMMNAGFWGNCTDISINAILNSDVGETGVINDDEIEYQEIVMEKVSSDFWGVYKVHMLKTIEKYDVDQEEWRLLRRQTSMNVENITPTMRLTIQSQNKYLVGKVAGSNIFDSNQKLIVKKGDVITTEIIEKATLANVLVELILNMTLPELEGTYE